MAYQSFEDLEVWQRGCRLSVSIFEIFANCRTFSLKDQVERSGLSIPSNIAEGAERGSAKDFAHFLNFSKGSCGELRTHLYIARKLTLLPKKDFDNLVSETKEISSMLQGLRRSLLTKTRAKMKRARRHPSLKLNS
jgi:four helix bundle protein